ncbi:LOW QUALITY PROTEIN: sorting nexin-17-like [Ptychodera flava]|uniref:LOW QUALITY PROTEIN: sorting nexin-17-like n=1 Tax=Ptychodera flava TaxID=63121 RepID=UPI00396A1ECF
MHFSIPDTQELKGEGNAAFTAYNIHVNGVFHCAVRYSQLYDFYEKLKKEYGNAVTANFPPKKILSLTPVQVEERREKLEKFIQIISKSATIASGPLFNGFFLSAQQETQKQEAEDVELDVYLLNGHKITVQIMSTDQTDDVLEAVASNIDLADDYVYYFALFLIKKDPDGTFSIVRKMQDFESPYISLKTAGSKHKIVLRKSFWDPSFDDDLLDDRVAMNLLYVQAVSDIERGWTLATKEQLERLEALQSKGSKKDYLRLSRTLKYYGFIQFKPCATDYPVKNTKVIVGAGNRELNFRVRGDDGQLKEGNFKVTRMRCWRITTSINEENGEGGSGDRTTELELSFEYLVAKDKLQWIAIQSDQAILISICLQGMVDELIMKKQGGRMKRPQDRIRTTRRDFKRRDGHVKSPSNNSISTPESPSDESASAAQKAKESVKKISDKLQSVKPFGTSGHQTSSHNQVHIHSDKFQSVSFKPVRSKTPSAVVENDVFEDIGDDDL